VAPRPTLGFFLDYLDDGYQLDVLSGVESLTTSAELNLLVVAGGILGLPSNRGPRNFVFDAVGPHAVDAALLLSGALSNYGGIASLDRFRQRFGDRPVCSIGMSLNGAASVLSNNAWGMREALVHLIETHGHRRIAFLRGPEANVEADERFRIYLSIREEYHLEASPELSEPGDFSASNGFDAMKLLLDTGAGFDAVACANDALAFGALGALSARGIEVPKQVAVVGFDDVRAARFARIPLSTVRQPLAEQGRLGSEILVSMLRDVPVTKTVSLPTSFVTRKSCGCPTFRRCLQGSPQNPKAASFDAALRIAYDDIVARLSQIAGEAAATLESGWPVLLLNALAAEVQGRRADTFGTTLEGLLDRSASAGADMSRWHAVIASLRAQLSDATGGNAELQRFCEELWEQAHVLVGLTAERIQAEIRLADAEAGQRLYACADRLMQAHSVERIFGELASQLPELGISTSYVALRDGARSGNHRNGAGSGDECFTVRLAWNASLGRLRELEGRAFDAAQLFSAFPNERRRVLVALPLSLGQDELGVLVVEKGPSTRNLFEKLAAHVSHALGRFAAPHA
jgi:DNA-binding LacI/PurR family transcriptional regulator